MKVRYTYRLRPGVGAVAYLLREWDACRFVWNDLVAHSRAIHAARETIALAGAAPVTFGPAQADKRLTWLRRTVTDPDGRRWLAEGSSVAQQQTVRDFAAARARALADIAARVPPSKRAGMPRFRKRAVALPTMNYTNHRFSLRPDDTGQVRLCLPGGVRIPVVWSRPLPSTPSSVRVSQDSLGHWYASFVVDAPEQELTPVGDGRALGIDWGVTETATTVVVDLATAAVDETTKYDLPHMQHGLRAAVELAHRQRQMARRRRPKGQDPSHGYRKARWKAARAAKKVARQRQDDARKWARRVVRDFDQIAVEDFRPKFLAKTTMARKAADAAIGSAERSGDSFG